MKMNTTNSANLTEAVTNTAVLYKTPQDFGAKGNDSTDDTAAVQNFINYICNNGLLGIVPKGIYKLTSTIQIPHKSCWSLIGINMGSSIFKMYADNTPIFRFVNQSLAMNCVKISDLGFNYANMQPNTNVNANCWYFEQSPYECTFERLSFGSGYYGLFTPPNTGIINFWGCTLNDLVFWGELTGGAIQIGNGTGVPNNHFGRIYILATNMTNTILALSGENCVIDALEINNYCNNNKIMNIDGRWVIHSFKIEGTSIDASLNKRLIEIQNASLIIGELSVFGIKLFQSISPCYCFSQLIFLFQSHVNLGIGYFDFTTPLDAGKIPSNITFCAMDYTSYLKIFYINKSPNMFLCDTFNFGDGNIYMSQYKNNENCVKYLSLSSNFNLQPTDDKIIYIDAAISADYSIYLPNVLNEIGHGLKYELIVPSGYINGNTLSIHANIYDSGSTIDTVLATLTSGGIKLTFISYSRGWRLITKSSIL